MAENQTPILDLDVFAPAPTKRVRVEGKEYGVIDPLDLSYADYTALLSLEARMSGLPESEQLALIRDQIRRCIPDLPAQVLEQLPLRKVAWLSEFVQRTVHASKADAGPLDETAQSN